LVDPKTTNLYSPAKYKYLLLFNLSWRAIW
jgi:hypothetical protein